MAYISCHSAGAFASAAYNMDLCAGGKGHYAQRAFQLGQSQRQLCVVLHKKCRGCGTACNTGFSALQKGISGGGAVIADTVYMRVCGVSAKCIR